ncbi:uncharacterized protein LOC120350030 isoform X2 [Nilaparvata lugens]|uniref:uncharacterized protein LOC120350030 isoform X2 n=1 Tax=Nilaparvata lugens TaxID=108931 RepID=UPI00193D1394|nr:uncharacterized protein LOC120350030 isoform X2 [Nilaparvata lugens]
MNMNISSSVRDCWGLFTHEAVMSALLRDISSTSSSSTTTEQSLTSAATQSFTCLLLNDLHSPITIDDVRKQAQSIRDTHVDRSCKRSCSDLEQTKHNSMLLDTLDLSKPSNNAGVVYGEVTEVKCLESDCFDCQINAPTKARASMLDFIQSLEKSTIVKHRLDHALGSNGMIKLVQNLKDTKITSLNLRNNWIDSDSLINLIQYLPSTQIKALDLSENFIGRIGFEYLSKVLTETQISLLNVSKNESFYLHASASFICDKCSMNKKSSMNKKCEDQILSCSVCQAAEIFENSATRSHLDLSFSVNENLNCLASILKNSNIELINLYLRK